MTLDKLKMEIFAEALLKTSQLTNLYKVVASLNTKTLSPLSLVN